MNLPSGWESKLRRLFSLSLSLSLSYLIVLKIYWLRKSNYISAIFILYFYLEYKARVIHNTGSEWIQIKEATEKARDAAISTGDEIGELTCTELLEALDLSRCLMFMRYDSNQVLI